MKRWAGIFACLFLLPVAPAGAAGCVLANDPPGDARAYPTGEHNPGYDLEQITVDVTPRDLVFRVRIGEVPPRPSTPTTAHYWRLWFEAPDGPVQVNFFRDYYGDGAKAALGTPPTRSIKLVHTFDARTRVLMAVLPHNRLGIEDGAELVGEDASSGPVHGVWLPPAGDDRHSFGSSIGQDVAALTKRIVVGRGCR